MWNNIAKTLVFVQVGLSLLAMTWAASLYFLATDWGMAKPRLEGTERVPSELDKRVAATKQAFQARDMVVPGVEKAQNQLYQTMTRFARTVEIASAARVTDTASAGTGIPAATAARAAASAAAAGATSLTGMSPPGTRLHRDPASPSRARGLRPSVCGALRPRAARGARGRSRALRRSAGSEDRSGHP